MIKGRLRRPKRRVSSLRCGPRRRRSCDKLLTLLRARPLPPAVDDTDPVAVHVLPAGRLLLDGLYRLGHALGYEVERERGVGSSGAAVDLAWYAAGDSGVPLMIFEVESSASSSMANNAMKVLSRDVDDFVKPLFFFHLLLAGGPDNDRIQGLRRQWGTHNYKVYRLNERPEKQRLLLDIVRQHRRVNAHIPIEALRDVLVAPPWAEIDRPQLFEQSEQYEFEVDLLGAYSRCAIDDSFMLTQYLRRLAQSHSGDAPRAQATYGGVIGDYLPGLLEVSLLISQGLIPDDLGPDRLECWQNSADLPMRLIGPTFGLSHDYDSFILAVAPFTYAIAGLLLRHRPDSFAWLVQDLTALVVGESQHGIPAEFTLAPALWLCHLCASGLAIPESSSRHGNSLVDSYSTGSRVIDEAGGVPSRMLHDPPVYINMDEPERWIDCIRGRDQIDLPSPQDLNAPYGHDGLRQAGGPSFARLVLLAMTSDGWTSWHGRQVCLGLRGL